MDALSETPMTKFHNKPTNHLAAKRHKMHKKEKVFPAEVFASFALLWG